MKNLRLASLLLALGYAVATVLGISTYYIHEVFMWICLFTISPVLFIYLFYLYLVRARVGLGQLNVEMIRLIFFAIIVSFLLDALVYIALLPLMLNYKINLTFFVDQSPWIWWNYLTFVFIGMISQYLYKRKWKEGHLSEEWAGKEMP